MIRQALVSLALLSVFLALPGCPSASHDARVVIDVVATGVVEADNISAQIYTDHARVALAASASWDAYLAAMQPDEAREAALRAADAALRAADAVVTAWDQGGAGSWIGTAICLVGALEQVRIAFEAGHVPIPPELASAIEAMAAFTGTCSAPAPSTGGV